jgi:DTW domain-containing protein
MIKDIELSQFKGREFCWSCRQPGPACYCYRLKPFDPQIEFVVLIHKIEARRRIATGRMSSLLLKRSLLLEGDQFDSHAQVNALIARSDLFPVVLYPGRDSVDLSTASDAELARLTPAGKRLLVFVIDGTWATARRTMRLSANLSRLPRICFSPRRESQFKVRKQPAAHCLSTLEAIHETIELLGESQGFDTASREHDHMLDIFSFMVERQRQFVPKEHADGTPAPGHKPRTVAGRDLP